MSTTLYAPLVQQDRSVSRNGKIKRHIITGQLAWSPFAAVPSRRQLVGSPRDEVVALKLRGVCLTTSTFCFLCCTDSSCWRSGVEFKLFLITTTIIIIIIMVIIIFIVIIIIIIMFFMTIMCMQIMTNLLFLGTTISVPIPNSHTTTTNRKKQQL